MFYDSELSFLKSILKNISVNITVTNKGERPKNAIDRGLRAYFGTSDKVEDFFESPHKYLRENVIYTATDEFYLSYIMLLLPDSEEGTTLIAGPYLETDVSENAVRELIERFSLSPKILPQIKKYYSAVKVISNKIEMLALFSAFGEKIWGNADNFAIEVMEADSGTYEPITVPSEHRAQEDAALSVNALESRYETERELMLAVSQGKSHKADLILSGTSAFIYEKRASTPLRDIKNYSIILNTLLRKSAEYGSVHPLYIDSISSDFAEKIENLTSHEQAVALQQEMVKKYCQLVKQYSMKNYSLLVQKVLTRIDSDLTADLSLNTQAKLLNVNPSYLSALFKKETGGTLTDYVNRKRVEHAVHLLKSTSLQIQTVAQYCGIMDVNYFTKIFKKYTGKTPKEYRNKSSKMPNF